QHHGDLEWDPTRRLGFRMIRVMGRDPASGTMLTCDGYVVADQPNSLGAANCFAVWYASQKPDPSNVARQVPLWANAFPALMEPPPSGGTQSAQGDLYNSNVTGSNYATPAFDQDPADAQS